jgi:hypothetical protein
MQLPGSKGMIKSWFVPPIVIRCCSPWAWSHSSRLGRPIEFPQMLGIIQQH